MDIVLVEGNNELNVQMVPIPPTGLIGDLNDDGVINILDLTLLERYIAGLSVSTPLSQEEFLRRADVNGDGNVNSLDITALELLIAGGEPPNGDGFYWLLPTGHIDPDNQWDYEANAYDGDTDTYAETWTDTLEWSGYIEFTIPATEISVIRHWATSPLSPKHCEVDVYSPADGAWHPVYENGFGGRWTEAEIPGGLKLITRARMRFFNNSYSRRMRFRLHELHFWGS